MAVKIRQRDLTDCGAACIASILSHYGIQLPISVIRQHANTGVRGTNVYGIISAFKKFGCRARGVRSGIESLKKSQTPAIALVIINGALNHFVVIHQIFKESLEIMDPADGQVHNCDFEEFKKKWTGILVLVDPIMQSGNRKPNNLNVHQLWTILLSYKLTLCCAIAASLIYTSIGLSTSAYLRLLIDSIFKGNNRQLLLPLSLAMVFLLLIQSISMIYKDKLILITGHRIDQNLIKRYINKLTNLPQFFFDSMRTGEILSRVNDAVKIRTFITQGVSALATNFFIILFSFCLMFTYYWRLALLSFSIIPLYSIIYYVTNKIHKKVELKLMEESSEMESYLIESVTSITTIKAFGLENFIIEKGEVRLSRLLKTAYSSGLTSIFSSVSTETISRLFTILVLWAGATFVINNEITPGELLSFYALMAYFTGPAASLVGTNKLMQNALISAQRLLEIMELENERPAGKSSEPRHVAGSIHFRNVVFSYGSGINVFENFSLEIEEGKITAFAGESGSGKSTFLAMLQRLYPIEQGNIVIGADDFNNLSIAEVRRAISIVPQKIELFSGTLASNIAIGESTPDLNKMISVCQDLGMMDFVNQLPHGFNTHLGENGALLSGGERQKIAIARALYKEHSILILDEATSSLDSASEHYIHKILESQKKLKKTVIIIAHRLSSLVLADKIVVLHQGKIAEEGNHEGLMMKRGAYYNLWKAQFPMMN